MALNTEEARLYAELGLIHIKQHRLAEALDDFNHAITADPEHVLAYQHRGTLHAMRQQYQEAVADFQAALQRQPDNAPAHFGMGGALHKLQDYAGALEHLERAAALGHPQAGQYIGRVRAKLAETEAAPERVAPEPEPPPAEPPLPPEPEPEPTDPEALTDQGLQLLAQRHYDEALALFQKALALDPHFAKAHFNAATILHGQGELTVALEHLKQAVQAGYDPAKPLAAEVYRKLKQRESLPATPPAGEPGAATPETLLKNAAQTLTKFARYHCGADREAVQRTEKGVFGVGERQITVQEVRWAVSMEERYILHPDGTREGVRGVELDIQQTPRAVIRVTVHDAENYLVQIMAEETIPKTKRRALLGKISEVVPATSPQLLALLNHFIVDGLLVKEENYLRYRPAAGKQ